MFPMGADTNGSGSRGFVSSLTDSTRLPAYTKVWDGGLAQTTTRVAGGCAGSMPPMFDASGTIGSGAMLTAWSLTPMSPVFVFAGTAGAPTQVPPGCTILLETSTIALIAQGMTSSVGQWYWSGSIPPNPALLGAQYNLQAAVQNSSAPSGWDITNAAQITLGFSSRVF